MMVRNMILLAILCVNLPTRAGTPFNWGEEELLARRLMIRKAALQAGQSPDTLTVPLVVKNSKSVGKAALFSAVLPGSGQFYAKSYVKAAIFLAVEATAWAVNISYKAKGDDKDGEFKEYANTRWDEYRYWSYVNWDNRANPEYAGLLVPENLINTVSFPDGRVWYLIDESYYQQNRELIIGNLRQVEQREYSHRLPETKTQQYYEMIGKYPMQFGNAWDDASFNREYSGPDNITVHNDFYMDMRDQANKFYDVAQYGLMVALINHVISSVDAGFTARNYNRRQLRMEASYRNYEYKGEYVNMLGVNLRW